MSEQRTRFRQSNVRIDGTGLESVNYYAPAQGALSAYAV